MGDHGRTPGTAPRAAGRAAAFALLGAGSLIGMLLASQNWWNHPAATTAITGNQVTGSLAGVLAGAAAAGTGLAALSGRRARTALGVLLAVLGLGMVVVAVTVEVDAASLSTGPAVLPGAGELSATGLRWAYLACGPLVVAGAGLLALRARSWPARRDRFARVGARAAITAEDDATDVWKAMDAGFDPTHDDPGASGDPSGRKPSDRRE
ncbi:MAG: Trp biosynthesis-associated membrane protein [Propionibacteriaceae bacterium]|nr:Trp biosynthesis-associated membrane protein [Propionibacteriaceae bacterium]